MPLVLTAEQMRAVDRAAIDRLGVPGVVLMENAGRGVAEVVARERPRLRGLEVRIVCGAGQNGGDGFVIARHLANAGANVRILLAAPRDRLAGDAGVFAGIVERGGGIPLEEGAAVADVARWRQWLSGAEVIVDALFGTGLRSDLTGAAAAAVEAMNGTAGALRVAVDLPSGLDANSGEVRGTVVQAHVTATMGARKVGMVLDPALPLGRVEVIDLGVSVEALVAAAGVPGPFCHWVDAETIRPLLPRRQPGGHKGTAGHLLVIAGSPGKTGAAALVGMAAMRAGAGLVTVASTRAGQAALDAKVLEVMTARYTDSDGDGAEAGSFEALAALAARMKAVALGPGIPTGEGMRELVHRLVAELPLPVVVDADALNLLGGDASAVARRAPAPRILTPHPGEMARLAGVSSAVVQRDRLAVARRLAAETRAVVVLKGARTVIAEPDGTTHVNPAANPALGTAGSGDVLTGVLGALCGQGLAAIDAARAGVFVHGLAADEASAALGTRHLVAGDLPAAIARVIDQQLRIHQLDAHDRPRRQP